MTSYISESAGVRDMFDKDGNYIGGGADHWIDKILDQVGWDDEGRVGALASISKNKFETIKQRKRMLYSAKGKVLFLENMKKMVQSMSVKEDELLLIMNVAMNRGDKIRYANGMGMVYGARYFLLVRGVVEEDLKKYDNELKKIFLSAEENGISNFDVIRYYRFIDNYNTIIKVPSEKNVKDKIKYKKIVVREKVDISE